MVYSGTMSAPVADSDLRAGLRRRYLDNLAALYPLDRELAGRLESIQFATIPDLELTRSGDFTVRITADDGRAIHAHSAYDPRTEARRFVSEQLTASRAGDADDEADVERETPCFLLCGLGLGYHVAELEAQSLRPLVIVAEEDLGLLKAAFCVTDFTTPLRERRLIFITEASKAQVHDHLRPILTPLMLGLRMLLLPHARRFHAEFQRQVSALMREFVAFSRVQVVTLVRNSRISLRNVALNMPKYLASFSIEELAQRARGYPAVLVAAGPSLARNLPLLDGLRDRAVIIGVQTVLKTLLQRGIHPHFVTSIDYHDISGQFFRGVEDFGSTVLVADARVASPVLDAFNGRTCVLPHERLGDFLQDAAPTRGHLAPGSTVAHLSFFLAEYLGCDPIILVGQDLSFSDALYYPPGMQIEQIWGPEFSRFVTVEMRQWERVMRMRAGLAAVEDVHGRQVYADEQMQTYAEQFEVEFLRTPARVIQTAEGGRRLRGAEVLPFANAIAEFCARPMPADLLQTPEMDFSAQRLTRGRSALEQRQRELEEIRAIACEARDLLERLSNLVDHPQKFNALIAQMDVLRSRMSRMGRTYSLVSQASQLAELRRIQADRAIHDSAEETPAMARRRLRRDCDYVEAFIEGCDFVLTVLPPAIARLQGAAS